MEIAGHLTKQGEQVLPDWNVIDWRAGDLSKLGTQVKFSYEAGQSASYISYTTTITSQPAYGSAGLAVPKMRITNNSGNSGGNTRIAFPIIGSTCRNGEIKALWLDRKQDTADQLGLVFRMQPDAANGNRTWAFWVWNDGIFGVESLLNLDWNRAGSTGGLDQGGTVSSGGGNGDMPGLQVWRTVFFGSKIGTTITLNLGADHGVQVGDNVSIKTDEVDENTIVVTAVGPTWIRLTSAYSTTNPIYNVGTGRIMSRAVMPYYVHARIIDDVFMAKMWRQNDAEPDWTDNTRVLRMINPTVGGGAGPQGPGLLGIYAGHLTDATHYSDFGSVWWRSLD